jgi:aryl-alcohol dehydrogenase-like predicted oxidoreductase
MRYRQLGSSDLTISEIGLGTWRSVSRGDQPLASRLLLAALDLGITLIDTADSYGDAQEAIGHALRGVRRDAYVISTKVYYRAGGETAGSLAREHIVTSTEQSLRALAVEEIDLLSAHRFDPGTPLEETVGAFAGLIAAGKIRHYGVSEWAAPQIEAACAAADRLGVPRPVANQPQYSVLWRVPEGLVMPACRRLGLGVTAFWPLAQGVLTGKYRAGSGVPAGSRADAADGRAGMAHLLADPLLARVGLFARLARLRGLTATQLALAWVLRSEVVASALVGASSPRQLTENAGGSGVTLDAATLGLIDQVLAGCVHDDPAGTG